MASEFSDHGTDHVVTDLTSYDWTCLHRVWPQEDKVGNAWTPSRVSLWAPTPTHLWLCSGYLTP